MWGGGGIKSEQNNYHREEAANIGDETFFQRGILKMKEKETEEEERERERVMERKSVIERVREIERVEKTAFFLLLKCIVAP